MSPVGKRRRSGEYHDLISNLPAHLITCILDRMPIKAAARTSILSKNWKNIWQCRSRVVLGRPFVDQLVSKQQEDVQSLISQTVDKILLAHNGPMSKFCLFIPLNIDLRPYYDSWMSLLFTKGVEDLELVNMRLNPMNYMPCYFFSCSQLRRLLLLNYRLDPPPNFLGFRSLTLVYLIRVRFDAPMSFGPQLNQLFLIQCFGIHHLGLQFTHHNKNINKFKLLRAKWLELWDSMVNDKDVEYSMKECFDMHRFLSSTPNMSTLILNSICLTFMDPSRTLLMENMQTLVLYNVEFYDLHQISNLLNLIRSSPNLQTLRISVAPQARENNPVDLEAEQ